MCSARLFNSDGTAAFLSGVIGQISRAAKTAELVSGQSRLMQFVRYFLARAEPIGQGVKPFVRRYGSLA